LAGAKERLDRLDLYPEPVRIDRVRLTVFPAFFRVPGFRRYRGYTVWRTILLREPPGEGSSDLLTHELCHVWQMQHRPRAAMWAWLRYRYADNPFEREARRAVAETRSG
jgi:hypothetical protein